MEYILTFVTPQLLHRIRNVLSDSSTMLALRTLCLRGAPRRSLLRKRLSSSSSIILPPGSEPEAKAVDGGNRLLRELCAKIRVVIECCRDISMKAITGKVKKVA